MLLDPSSPLARSCDDEGLLKGGVVACDELKRGCDVGDCVWEIQNGAGTNGDGGEQEAPEQRRRGEEVE